MNQLGIVTTKQSNRTSVHTLKCISAWMQDGNRIDNPFYVRLKDRRNERENRIVISDETTNVLLNALQDNTDSHIGINFPNSKVGEQTEAMEEVCVSDADFSFVGKLPVISDEGEVLSPSYSFSSISVSPQPAGEEKSNEDVLADSQM